MVVVANVHILFFVSVVTTTITQAGFRVQENVGLIVLCVTKDLETAIKFNVTLTSVDGSATSGLKL